jgi:ABC-type Zn uptake system ZnuABC Zn-binding protein ZnuA
MILGWSSKKMIIFGLIALCILAIILTLVFCFLARKKKNKKSQPSAGTTTTPKGVVTKNVSADPKYQPVPNV